MKKVSGAENNYGVEVAGSPLESRGTLRALLSDLRSLEGPASAETLRALRLSSRSLGSMARIPEARKALGTAADAVFFEYTRSGPRRSPERVEDFVRSLFAFTL